MRILVNIKEPDEAIAKIADKNLCVMKIKSACEAIYNDKDLLFDLGLDGFKEMLVVTFIGKDERRMALEVLCKEGYLDLLYHPAEFLPLYEIANRNQEAISKVEE